MRRAVYHRRRGLLHEKQKSGKYLQPVGQVIGNGNNMEQVSFDGSVTQQWQLTRQSNGTYSIINMGSAYSYTNIHRNWHQWNTNWFWLNSIAGSVQQNN